MGATPRSPQCVDIRISKVLAAEQDPIHNLPSRATLRAEKSIFMGFGLVIGSSGALSRGLRESGFFGENLEFVGRSTEPAVDVADRFAINGILRRTRPDFVLNLSGLGRHQSHGLKDDIWKVNVEGVRNLCEAIESESPQSHLIHIGSAEVFGIGDKIVDETTEFTPATHYAKSKAAASRELEQFGERGGRFSEVICFQVESGFSQAPYLMDSIAKQFVSQRGFSSANFEFDGPDFLRSIADARVLYEILPKLVDSPVNGKLLVGGPKRYTLRILLEEFIDVAREIFEDDSLRLGEISLKREGKNAYPAATFLKATELYGLRPTAGLDEPIRKLLVSRMGVRE